MDQFATTRFKTSSGLEVVADVGGAATAPPVILLHGGGQTRHSWDGAMREFVSQGYHVINLDCRGHGDSDWASDGDYSLPALASDLHAVISTLPRLPALIGASMGGAAALYLAGNSPEPMATCLVLVDIVPRPDRQGSSKIANFMAANPDGFRTIDEAADAVAAYYPDRPRPKDTSGLMKNLRPRDDGRLYWHWDPMFLSMQMRPGASNFADNLLDACRRIKIPTLLVRGLKSDVVTDANVQEFRHSLPALEVCDVAGAGHMVAGDRNDAFNRAVIDFMRAHVQAAVPDHRPFIRD